MRMSRRAGLMKSGYSGPFLWTFENSTTFTVPVSGTYRVTVYGGGGGGAKGYDATYNGDNVSNPDTLDIITAGNGGGGGGSSKQTPVQITLTKDNVITVTIGNGGGSATNGNTSSFGSHASATGGSKGSGSAGGAKGGDIGIKGTNGSTGAENIYLNPSPSSDKVYGRVGGAGGNNADVTYGDGGKGGDGGDASYTYGAGYTLTLQNGDSGVAGSKGAIILELLNVA